MNLGGELAGSRNIDMRIPGRNNCPDEAELSAYLERRLNAAGRDSVEGHLASCEECRESVALLVYLQHRAVDVADAAHLEQSAVAVAQPVSGEELRSQTSKVVALIAQDEQRRRFAKTSTGRRSAWRLIPTPVFAVAAMLVVAFLSWGVYEAVNRESAADVAMNNLAKAVAGGRKTRTVLARVQYSHPVSVRRGGSEESQLEYQGDRFIDAALATVRDASDTQAQEVKAKTLVATADRKNITEGLRILQQLLGRGVSSAELFNDLGAAYHAEGDYDRAIESFTEALNRDPGMMQALFNRALASIDKANATESVEERAKLKQQARADLDRFLEICPNPEWQNEAGREKSEIDRQ